MILIERPGVVYSNEQARDKLRQLWPMPAYQSNIEMLIPQFAKQLVNGELPITGVSVDKR